MSYNEDLNGYAVKHGAGTDSARKHNPFQVYELTVDFSDLGSGASDAIACSGFPTNVFVCGQSLEIVTAFAGEADLAVTGGDTADADGRFTSFNLDSVAAGHGAITVGAEGTSGPRWEADYATAGADLTFSATELDDVTAGKLIYRVYYFAPALSTD
jgi:hypothetical protein